MADRKHGELAHIEPELMKLIENIRPSTPEQVARAQEAADQAESREKMERRRRALESSGIDGRIEAPIRDAIIEERLEPNGPIDAVKRWYIRGEKPCIALLGDIGGGKTVAAATLLAQCGGLFYTAHDFIRVFAGLYGPSVIGEQKKIRDCRLLVIDDVGREPKGDREKMEASLLEALDARQSIDTGRTLGTLTIITANMFVGEFKAKYHNPRLLSRMFSMAQAYEYKGPDLRRAGR